MLRSRPLCSEWVAPSRCGTSTLTASDRLMTTSSRCSATQSEHGRSKKSSCLTSFSGRRSPILHPYHRPATSPLWRRGAHLAQPLESIPPVVFFDPEATASTTETPGAYPRDRSSADTDEHHLRRRSRPYRRDSRRVLLHLGSRIAYRRPGGPTCIIPVGP